MNALVSVFTRTAAPGEVITSSGRGAVAAQPSPAAAPSAAASPATASAATHGGYHIAPSPGRDGPSSHAGRVGEG